MPRSSPRVADGRAPRLHAARRKVKERGSTEGKSPGEENAMPTFVMLTNLTSEGVQTLKNNPTPGPGGQQGGRAARRQGQGAVGHARAVRLHHHRRGARREDDGQGLGRARLARNDEQPDPRGDSGRGLREGAFERFSSSAEGGASTRSSAPSPARRRSRSCSARPATPGSPRGALPRGRRRGRRRARRRRPRRGGRPGRRRPRGAARGRARRRARGARGSRPSGRAREAARLEGSKLHAKELMERGGGPDRLPHGAPLAARRRSSRSPAPPTPPCSRPTASRRARA